MVKKATESWLQCLQRYCSHYSEDIRPILAEVDHLKFVCLEDDDAYLNAAWLHGLWDEEDDIIPSAAKRRVVPCEAEDIVEDKIRSVAVYCTRCGHSVISYGRSDRSIRRCLALMREECPNDEANYYTCEEGEE